MIKSLIDWTRGLIVYGPWALFILAFAESSFFPIPPDILLIALSCSNPSNALFYALITTAASVLGGMFGYAIGLKGGRPILEKFISQEKITMVQNYYQKYDAWAIAIAGFSPLPYKVFTVSAGTFFINFKRFTIASILSRGARFFLEGAIIMIVWPIVKDSISEDDLQKYINYLSILVVAMVILGFYIVKRMTKKAAGKTI